MDKVSVKLNVFFEDPFWVGVFEQMVDQQLSVCKITFGAEPKSSEIYEMLLKNNVQLRFSPAVATAKQKIHHNPKRMQREIHKLQKQNGIGTKSQQALKCQQEQVKTERKTIKREKREADKQHQFELKQQKRKEKHRGR